MNLSRKHAKELAARKQAPLRTLLAIAIVVVAICGVIANWLWYPSKVSIYATILTIVVLLLLMRQAGKPQLLQLPATLERVPQVKAEWAMRGVVSGLLCLLAAFVWAALLEMGRRAQLLDGLSAGLAWLLVSPAIALIAVGLVLMARSVFRQSGSHEACKGADR